MSKRRDREFLLDIKEAGERIRGYIGAMSYEEFLQDIKTQDAVIRNIEIIGEAVKNLSKSLKEEQRDIAWKNIAGMRDKIIHFYFGVKWEIVWSVVNDKIPELLFKIEAIINEMKGK
ncbi:MAG: DUF86 domain-containing protein [Peptococcaceae bacterium]